MPEPIREQIAVLARANVLLVTIAGGYQHDLAGVERPLAYAQNKPKPRPLLAIQIESDPVREEENDEESNLTLIGWSFVIAWEVYLMPSQANATPIETLLNRLEADIQKAAMLTPLFGGLATRSTPLDSITFEEEGGFYGRIVPLRIEYQTRENDPYAGRV
jgi:hypothetical protein